MVRLIGGKGFVKEYLDVILIAVNNADRIKESYM
jgi:3-deoxy-D-manno-octulosonate 8-phosphate phosphatase KdsC-like HAD superfamily phosphatase